MTPEQIASLSAFLNTQADLPVDIQVIAEELKASLTPVPVVESTPEPVVEAPTPSTDVEENNG